VGDAAHIDEDGYVWFAGRADEIIKIAGPPHRHDRGRDGAPAAPAVAEAGVSAARTSCAARSSRRSSASRQGRRLDELRRQLLATVPRRAGAGRRHRRASFVHPAQDAQRQDHAPGAQGRRPGPGPGDITTIEDEGSVDEARAAVAELRAGLHST
jgi:acetyl-CoA synthetase